jgi:hypothetical protein
MVNGRLCSEMHLMVNGRFRFFLPELKASIVNLTEDFSSLGMIPIDIKETIASNFSCVKVLHCPRSCNSLAHSIAATGRLRMDAPSMLMNGLIPGVTFVVSSLLTLLFS